MPRLLFALLLVPCLLLTSIPAGVVTTPTAVAQEGDPEGFDGPSLTAAEEAAYIYNWAHYGYGSSQHSSGNYPPHAMVNGDRKGTGWGAGTGGWADGTPNQFPDYVEIHFDREKLIQQVNVFTLQDDYRNAVEPTPEMTFGLYGITDFNVGYFDTASNQWVYTTQIRGNNKVWRQIDFPTPIRTKKLSVVVLNAASGGLPNKYSRIVEVEAWGRDAVGYIFVPSDTDAPPPNPCGEGGTGPCQLSINLLDAMQGKATLTYRVGGGEGYTANWRKSLDWDFSGWTRGTSKNVPPLAHALALWRSTNPNYRAEWDDPADGYDPDPLAWWNTYLACQNGEGCDVAVPIAGLPSFLPYLLTSELFSNTYDAETTRAVVAVHHWAIKEIAQGRSTAAKQTLLDGARKYLRNTWAFYTLAAGAGPALSITHRGNRHLSPVEQRCQRNSNKQWYQGPYLPLAGMRSAWGHLCQDDRSPLFTRAILPEWNTIARALPPDSAVNMKEEQHQLKLLNFIEAQQDTLKANRPQTYPGPTLNAYALDAAMRDRLVRHMLSGDDGEFLFGFLQTLKVSVPYHFLAWTDASGKQVRLTVMEKSRNTNTIAVYAVLYRHATGHAEALLPWEYRSWPTAESKCFTNSDCEARKDFSEVCYQKPDTKMKGCWTRPEREDVTHGQARLRNDSGTAADNINPTKVWGTNIGSGENPDEQNPKNRHGRIEEQIQNLALPPAGSSRRKYHFIFYPDKLPERVW